jgi:NAD(P)-dependent dehydrogenase (short-subunit alcohol dehydrogenase family)
MSQTPLSTPVPGRLAGRRAFITGGTRGIGEAIASAMLAEGAEVVVASRRADSVAATVARLSTSAPGRVAGIALHMGQLDRLEASFQEARALLGDFDILVNNAATNPYFGPMESLEMSAWDKTFDVNLKGPFQLSRAFSQQCAGKEASILFVSSIYGTVGAPFQGVYAMTKAAVISLTRTLAAEWAPQGIRVNAIAPGLIETKFAAAITSEPTLAAMFTDRAPLHRIGEPAEVAGAAVFLASHEARFITGHTLTVDGGYTIV